MVKVSPFYLTYGVRECWFVVALSFTLIILNDTRVIGIRVGKGCVDSSFQCDEHVRLEMDTIIFHQHTVIL